MTSEILTEEEFNSYIFKCLCFTHKIKENECDTIQICGMTKSLFNPDTKK